MVIMSDEKIGSVLTGIGIVLVILNLAIWNDGIYGLLSAILAAGVIIAGLYFTSWKNKGGEN